MSNRNPWNITISVNSRVPMTRAQAEAEVDLGNCPCDLGIFGPCAAMPATCAAAEEAEEAGDDAAMRRLLRLIWHPTVWWLMRGRFEVRDSEPVLPA